MIARLPTFALTAVLVGIASPARAEPEPMIDCANASATSEMNFCASRDFDTADADLNATYKAALRAAPGMAGDAPYDAKSWAAALRASQRAWIAFRDAECQGHVPMFWTGGTGATADVIGCQTEMTTARTKQLKMRYEDGEAAPADAK